MANVRKYFFRKHHFREYEDLTLWWNCVENITSEIINQIPDNISNGKIADAIHHAVTMSCMKHPVKLTDWERLAVYVIDMANFVLRTRPALCFMEIAQKCHLPDKLTGDFMVSVAEKMHIKIENFNLAESEENA